MAGVPGVMEALELLYDSQPFNPGPWVAHCLYTGEAARRIAAVCGMDEERAHTLGLLHDIGRRFGAHDLRHGYDGYRFLLSKGWLDAAKICLTHCNVAHSPAPAGRRWDCTMAEMADIHRFFSQTSYDEWDDLIALCDGLAGADGFLVLEKRLIDVALRRGISPELPREWKRRLELYDLFSRRAGQPVYALLPGIAENTLGFDPKDEANG